MAGKSFRSSVQREPHYQLPELAYERLCNTRDEIRFLAELTSRIDANPDPLEVSPRMLFRCFNRLAEALTDVVRDSAWPSKQAERRAPITGRKRRSAHARPKPKRSPTASSN